MMKTAIILIANQQKTAGIRESDLGWWLLSIKGYKRQWPTWPGAGEGTW